MKLKKFLGFGLAFAAASLMTSAIYAAEYSVESTSSKPGETVIVNVEVAPNDGDTSTDVNGFAVQVAYDSSVLTPVAKNVDANDDDSAYATTRYATNELGTGVMVSDVIDNETGNDIVAIGWADANAVSVTEKKTVATITFTVNSDTTAASTALDVTVKADAKSSTELAAKSEVAEGTITLGSSFLRGDANGDGEITVDDVTAVLNHIMDLKELEGDKFKAAAAANGENDTEITIDDVTAIVNHILNIKKIG